jgi:hypothetical protein
MVCSRGCAPTQNQLMHFQRCNVAMSRARDQICCFRSLDLKDVPSTEDIKIPIMEFFQTADISDGENKDMAQEKGLRQLHPAQVLLERLLTESGYTVRSMGVVWKNGISVEHASSDTRVAVIVDCAGDSPQEWLSSYKQQKAIEQVGWKCFRVDIISLVANLSSALDSIIRFLSTHGIEEPVILYDQLEDESISSEDVHRKASFDLEAVNKSKSNLESDTSISEREGNEQAALPIAGNHLPEPDGSAIMVISSDDEDRNTKNPKVTCKSALKDYFDTDNDALEASTFGETVELDFLFRNGKNPPERSDNLSAPRNSATNVGDIDYQEDTSNSEGSVSRDDSNRGKLKDRLSGKTHHGRDRKKPALENFDSSNQARNTGGRRKRATREDSDHIAEVRNARGHKRPALEVSVAVNKEINRQGLNGATARISTALLRATKSTEDPDSLDKGKNHSDNERSAEDDLNGLKPSRDNQDIEILATTSKVAPGLNQANTNKTNLGLPAVQDSYGLGQEGNNPSVGRRANANCSAIAVMERVPQQGFNTINAQNRIVRGRKSEQDDRIGHPPSDEESTGQNSKRSRKSYRRLEKYQRDGRWYPEHSTKREEDSNDDYSYDSDSDLKN